MHGRDRPPRIGFTADNPLDITFVAVTFEDIDPFWELDSAAMPNDQWRSRLLAVRPAYDLEYAIVAWKSAAVLVTTDAKMLDLAGGIITVKHPADVG